MTTRLAGKHVTTVLLILLVLVPTSVSYAQKQEGKSQKVEKFIELAERAREKTQTLINITYASQSALDNITAAGLSGELEANVTLFNDAVQSITNAEESLGKGDLEGATANVTFALEVFREVFKAEHTILRDSGVPRGQTVDAQGLIQAMERALERIERLEEIGDLPNETLWLLGNATLYLNIPQAMEWLQLGMVNETAHNLTQANQLIAQAHKTLKNASAEMNTKRIQNYFKVINNLLERLGRQIGKLENSTQVNATLIAADDLISEAQGLFDSEEYSEALEKLEDARGLLDTAEQQLKEQRRAEKGNGQGQGQG